MNQESRIKNQESNDVGFTLIELLTTGGIFVLITSIIVGILFVVLRGASKSDSVMVVRQNGEYAMEQMVRTIRYATSLDYPASCTGSNENYITVKDVNFAKTTFSCPAYNGSTGIKSNTTFLTNTNTVEVVAGTCSFKCTQSSDGPRTIGISFSLSTNGTGGPPEKTATIPFQSSVTMRNF